MFHDASQDSFRLPRKKPQKYLDLLFLHLRICDVISDKIWRTKHRVIWNQTYESFFSPKSLFTDLQYYCNDLLVLFSGLMTNNDIKHKTAQTNLLPDWTKVIANVAKQIIVPNFATYCFVPTKNHLAIFTLQNISLHNLAWSPGCQVRKNNGQIWTYAM